MAEPPTLPSALEVTALGAWYGMGDNQHEICQYLDFSVPQGKVLGLFGGNGSGKTTLLRVLAGLHEDKCGHIDYPAGDGGVAYVSQNFRESFFPWASLENNMLLVAPHPIDDRASHRARIREAMKALGVKLDLSLRPRQCSPSMLQQASLVRALSVPATVIIADEPFSAMDLDVAREVRRGFLHVIRQRRMAVVVALHDLEDIIEICDDVMLIPACPCTSRSGIHGVAQVQLFHNEVRSLMIDPQREGGRQSSVNMAPLIQRLLSIKGQSTSFR